MTTLLQGLDQRLVVACVNTFRDDILAGSDVDHYRLHAISDAGYKMALAISILMFDYYGLHVRVSSCWYKLPDAETPRRKRIVLVVQSSDLEQTDRYTLGLIHSCDKVLSSVIALCPDTKIVDADTLIRAFNVPIYEVRAQHSAMQ